MDNKIEQIFKDYIRLVEKENDIDEKGEIEENNGWYFQSYCVWDFEEMNEDTNMDIPNKCMRELKKIYPEIKDLSPIYSEKGWWGIQFKI
jgi:hypothetical protein